VVILKTFKVTSSLALPIFFLYLILCIPVHAEGSLSGFTFSGGNWSIKNQALVLSGPINSQSGSTAIHNTHVTEDFLLTLQCAAHGTERQSDNFFTLFNYVDSKNYYYVEFNEENSKTTSGLFKVTDGKVDQLVDIPYKIKTDFFYKIVINKYKNTLTIYLNDLLITRVTDTTPVNGKVGFGTVNNTATFDEFKVTTNVLEIDIFEGFSAPKTSQMIAQSGNWTIKDGNYILSKPVKGKNGNGNISVHQKAVPSRYFILESNGKVVPTSSAFDDFSLLFNYQDAKNYYYASFNESNDENTNGIFKVVSGVVTKLASNSHPIEAGVDYRIKVVKTREKIEVFLMDLRARDYIFTLVASGSDATFNGGKVGFGSLNNSAIFDNLTVVLFSPLPPPAGGVTLIKATFDD
jgi:hypothetical protein